MNKFEKHQLEQFTAQQKAKRESFESASQQLAQELQTVTITEVREVHETQTVILEAQPKGSHVFPTGRRPIAAFLETLSDAQIRQLAKVLPGEVEARKAKRLELEAQQAAKAKRIEAQNKMLSAILGAYLGDPSLSIKQISRALRVTQKTVRAILERATAPETH